MTLHIEDRPLTDDDLGAQVTYVPMHAGGDRNHPDVEHGVITSFNDKFVFVRYAKVGSGVATDPRDLRWATP